MADPSYNPDYKIDCDPKGTNEGKDYEGRNPAKKDSGTQRGNRHSIYGADVARANYKARNEGDNGD